MQKPGEIDSVRSKRVARFHLSNVRQCIRLLLSGGISPRIAPCCVNKRYTLVLLLDSLREISRNENVIVGMANNYENVSFVAAVRFWERWCGLWVSLFSHHET